MNNDQLRILHFGDLHPKADGKYAGKLVLNPQTGLSETFEDCRKGLQAMLDWERENPCDLAIGGGDIFDSDRPTSDEIALITWFIGKLLERMSFIIIPGNHDMDVHTTRATALHPFSMWSAANRHMAQQGLVVMEQPGKKTIQTGKGKVDVYGLPYPSKGRFKAYGGAEVGDSAEVVLAKMNQGLVDLVRGMASNLDPDRINLMVAHGTTSGAKVGAQPRSIAHDLMIPVNEMAEFDWVFLNHIHQHQKVAPNAAYSGSLSCQDFGEMGELKGWCVVELGSGRTIPEGTCRVATVEHINNPHSRRFTEIQIGSVQAECAFANAGYDLNLPETVYRFRGTVKKEDYADACLKIAKFEQSHPFTLNDLTIEQGEARTRDAGMTAMLSEEEAVERTLKGMIDDDRVPGVMTRHHELMGEAS